MLFEIVLHKKTVLAVRAIPEDQYVVLNIYFSIRTFRPPRTLNQEEVSKDVC